MITAKFYTHSSDKAGNESDFRDACADHEYEPSEAEIKESWYNGYEVEFDGYYKNGKFYATKVNGVELAKPTVI